MRRLKFLLLILGLTLLTSGCLGGGGGGGGGSTSSGFSAVSEDNNFVSSFASSGTENTGSEEVVEQVVIAHNPEPATMILWGSGLLGMALFKKRKKK